MARRLLYVCAGTVCLALAAAQFPVNAPASQPRERPLPPEFKFVSDSLVPVMHDPARAPWVLERLRPLLAKFPNHAPYRRIRFWALANTGASTAALAALTDSLVGGVSPSGREVPSRLQQATHCLELGQVLFARHESLATAESYVRRAIQYLEPTHPASMREACEDLLAQVVRARDAASPDSLRFPPPGDPTGLHVPRRVPGMIDVRVHDTIGGKDLATWIVQLLVALGAAYLGALLGGRTARQAAIAAIHTEREVERARALDRLQRRAESNLRRVEALSKRCADHKPDQFLGPTVGEELEVAWNLYYRVAEPIFTMGAGDLSERLDAFFVDCHTVAETVKALERRARDLEMEDIQDTGRAGLAQAARTKLPGEREAVMARIQELGARATALLGEVSAYRAGAAPGARETMTTDLERLVDPVTLARRAALGHAKGVLRTYACHMDSETEGVSLLLSARKEIAKREVPGTPGSEEHQAGTAEREAILRDIDLALGRPSGFDTMRWVQQQVNKRLTELDR